MNKWLLFLFLLVAGFGHAQELDIQAARVDTDETGQIVTLTGNASVSGTDFTISALLIRVYRDHQRVEAEGNVEARIHGSHITGATLAYDLGQQTALVTEGRLILPDGIVFDAQEIQALPDDRFQLINASMTSCPDCCRRWSFQADRIRVQKEGYAFFRNLKFRVGDHSWFYLPGLIYPAKTKRAFGLLIPEIGSSSKLGVSYRQDLYVPIGPSMDMTYTHDYYNRAGTGAGLEFRIARRNGEFGRFYGYSIHDKLIDERRSLLDASYNLELGNGSRIRMRAFEGDDFDLVRDFTFHNYNLAMREFYSSLWLDLVKPGYRVLAGVDRQNRLYTDGEFLFQQLPVFHVGMKPIQTGRHLLQASLDVRSIDNPLIHDKPYVRGIADISAQSTYAMGILSFSQKLKVEYRRYGQDVPLGDGLSLHGEWKFHSPEWRRTGEDWSHSFNFYAGVAYHYSEFDYPERISDPLDFVQPEGWNAVAGVETTLTRQGQTAVGGLYMVRNLSDHVFHNLYDPEQMSQAAPVIGFFQMPMKDWSVDLNVRYDPSINTLDRALIGLRYKDRLSLSWLRAYTLGSGKDRNSLIGSFTVPISETWSFKGRLDYDFSADDFRYREIQVQYYRDCIGFRIAYRNNAYSVNTSNEFTVSLVLRQIGELIRYRLGL